jgi:ankyrin repeat protein
MATSVGDFIAAIKSGDIDTVERALHADPDLANTHTEQGLSPLMIALYHQQPKLAGLIKSRAKGLSIFEAAAAGDKARVAALLESDPALVNAVSPDGFSALGLAAFFGHADVVPLLLERGAEPNSPSRNPMKVMPLHSAVANRDGALALKMAKLLLERGASVNVAQHGGWTPLQQAAAHGNVELVQLLLSRNADPAAKADDGRSAIDLARAGGHQAVVEALESRGKP